MCKTSSWYLLGALWINAWKERKLNRIALECFPFQADSHFMIATHQLVPGVLQKSFILSSIEVLIPNRRTCSNVRYQLIHIQVRECRQRAHRSKLQFDVLFFLFLTLIFDCYFFLLFHTRAKIFFFFSSRGWWSSENYFLNRREKLLLANAQSNTKKILLSRCVRFQHILSVTLSACDWKKNARSQHKQSASQSEAKTISRWWWKQQQKQHSSEEGKKKIDCEAAGKSKKPKAMGSKMCKCVEQQEE